MDDLSFAFSRVAEHRTTKNSQASRFMIVYLRTSANRVDARDLLMGFHFLDAVIRYICFLRLPELTKQKPPLGTDSLLRNEYLLRNE